VPLANPRVTLVVVPTPGASTLTNVPPAAPNLGLIDLNLGVIYMVVLRTEEAAFGVPSAKVRANPPIVVFTKLLSVKTAVVLVRDLQVCFLL
jgi:hypothetical protein